MSISNKSRQLFIAIFSILIVSSCGSNATVLTEKGSEVKVLIQGNELSPEQIKGMNNKVMSEYPDSVKIDDPTTDYNCHSYAFHSQDYENNIYWMQQGSSRYANDNLKYVTDGSFNSVNSLNRNDRILWVRDDYGTYEHSGIYQGNNKVKSKLGPYGLFEQSIEDVTDIYSSNLPNGVKITTEYYRD